MAFNQIPTDSKYCNDPETIGTTFPTAGWACPCFSFGMCRYWMETLEYVRGGHVGSSVNVYKRLARCLDSKPKIK